MLGFQRNIPDSVNKYILLERLTSVVQVVKYLLLLNRLGPGIIRLCNGGRKGILSGRYHPHDIGCYNDSNLMMECWGNYTELLVCYII